MRIWPTGPPLARSQGTYRPRAESPLKGSIAREAAAAVAISAPPANASIRIRCARLFAPARDRRRSAWSSIGYHLAAAEHRFDGCGWTGCPPSTVRRETALEDQGHRQTPAPGRLPERQNPRACRHASQLSRAMHPGDTPVLKETNPVTFFF